MGRHADEDDGLGVEALGLVDGGVADAAGAVLLLGAFPQVAAGEDAAVAERAFDDVGLGVEDEHVRRIAEAGFLPAGENGLNERTRVGPGGVRVNFRIRTFRKAILLPALISFALATMLPAQTCREVVRDSSGRIVQTIERQNKRAAPSGP